MLVEFNETAIIQYQNSRPSEGAAPKSANEEVGFLFRILGDPPCSLTLFILFNLHRNYPALSGQFDESIQQENSTCHRNPTREEAFSLIGSFEVRFLQWLCREFSGRCVRIASAALRIQKFWR
jgi:hypothetical protein